MLMYCKMVFNYYNAYSQKIYEIYVTVLSPYTVKMWLDISSHYPSSRAKHYMGVIATKPFLLVFGKVRFKPACSATETSQKSEISLAAS